MSDIKDNVYNTKKDAYKWKERMEFREAMEIFMEKNGRVESMGSMFKNLKFEESKVWGGWKPKGNSSL